MTEKISENIRVRFAPSPTGGLHLGGVRTVLYNYLFARKFGGKFILRIEDTDQTRFVEGAEQYIYDCLAWCGMMPDESPANPGAYGPYRQSERKEIYLSYAEKLVAEGLAYYAFDTPEELEKMRQDCKTDLNPSPQYDASIRMSMKNGLTLSKEEVLDRLQNKVPYVIRIKMPDHENIEFTDLIHGLVSFDSSTVDDKVLLKADGMPTYHLAVVVDDYLMKITHAFRGEEWLSSAPVHVYLWKSLFGLDKMPLWAHLPLILGPNGKLSKRDGAKFGFPVYAMNWTDPRNNEFTEGFKEKGFLPSAFNNMLAMLGWNSGTEQEVFDMEQMIQAFSIERIHKSGAKFDFEKAKWFNQEWIKKTDNHSLCQLVAPILQHQNITFGNEEILTEIIGLVKERCSLLTDFIEQSSYFFRPPVEIDKDSIQPKWNEQKDTFFSSYITILESLNWTLEEIEDSFKTQAASMQIKPGELQLPFRIMLVGGKFGPAVFEIAHRIGKAETISRIKHTLNLLNH
jgi:glutamyl-tRNA synthetase